MSGQRTGFFDASGILCHAGEAGRHFPKGTQWLTKARGLFQRAGHVEGKFIDDWKSPRFCQTQDVSFCVCVWWGGGGRARISIFENFLVENTKSDLLEKWMCLVAVIFSP